MRIRLLWFVLVSILLAACAAQPPATSTPTAAPTATLTAEATPTVAPPDTPTPSATAPPPTATWTPTVTPTPPTINPLTGLAVSDPADIDRRPLAIKIAHFPRRVRAAQVGLSFADNVWEHYAEGGVTRFTAIFLSQGAEKVGNVRSARLLDALLGEAYQAMLVASGSSEGTLNRLRQTDFFDRVIAEATGYSGCPLLCREEAADVSTDKLFTSTAALWELTAQLGLNGPQSLAGFVFDPQSPAGGAPAATIHIDFQLDNTVVEWRYDPAAQQYYRWIDTANLPALDPHVDALNGRHLSAANVVLLYVPHVSSNIREAEHGRFFSYDILMTGSGPAKLFRDGILYDVTWVRADKGMPQFVDAGGNTVPFKPGVTWFDIVTPASPTSFENGLFYVRFKAPNPFPDITPTP